METLKQTCQNILVTQLVRKGNGKREPVKTNEDNFVINPQSQAQLDEYGTYRSNMDEATRNNPLTTRIWANFNARTGLICYGMPLTVIIEKGRTNMFVATLIFKLLTEWTKPVERAFQEVLVYRKRTTQKLKL
jgi:hypothetical protein